MQHRYQYMIHTIKNSGLYLDYLQKSLIHDYKKLL